MTYKILIRIILILAFYLLLAPAASAKVPQAVPDFYESLGEGDGEIDTERVIAGLLARVEEEPYNYENYSRLAFVYDHIGDYENLLEAVRLEIAYLPEDAEGKDAYLGNFARALFLNGFWEEGKEWLDKADAINPNNNFNRWNAFKYYARFKKDYRLTARNLKRLNKLLTAPDRDVYYDAYLDVLNAGADPADIISLFRESVRLEPKNYKARRALGAAIRNSSEGHYTDNFPAAMKELKRALRLNPLYIPTYITIANAYMLLALRTNDQKYFGESLAWFDKGLEVDPKNLRLFFSLGYAFYAMKEYDKAIEKLQYAYDNGLQDDEVKRSLAAVYNDKADSIYKVGEGLDKGLELIEKSLALAPGDGVSLGTKAELLYKMGDYPQAHRYIKMASEAAPDNEGVRQSLKMIEDALAAGSFPKD
jgi:tetratricopeptide (TPR) repeat protein